MEPADWSFRGGPIVSAPRDASKHHKHTWSWLEQTEIIMDQYALTPAGLRYFRINTYKYQNINGIYLYIPGGLIFLSQFQGKPLGLFLTLLSLRGYRCIDSRVARLGRFPAQSGHIDGQDSGNDVDPHQRTGKISPYCNIILPSN